MRKRRILASILAVALVLSLGGVNISAATGSPMADAAEVSVPEGYIEHDYLKLYAFLETADADGVKNGKKLNENYDPADPTTWGTTVEDDEEGQSTITWMEWTIGEGEDEVTVRSLMIFNAPAADLCGQLDLSGCEDLRELYVQNNALTQVNLSDTGIQKLDCSGNQLTELNLSGCRRLMHLYCGDNQLTALELADCRQLSIVDCSENQLTALDLKATAALTELNCENNRLTTLGIYALAYPIRVDCSGNQLTNLDTSMMQFTQDLDCSDNLLTKLNMGNCSMLKNFSCLGNKLERLVFSQSGIYHVWGLYADEGGYVGYVMEQDEDGNATYAVVATPAEGNVFQGWYRGDNTLITKDPTIDVTRIDPVDAIDYYAQFTEGGGGDEEVEVPKGYNVNDYLKLRAFLEQADGAGVKNGFKLNENYDPDDVTTWGVYDEETPWWNSITWKDVNGEIRPTGIAFDDSDLSGKLDLSDCAALESITCNYNNLTELIVNGATSLSFFECQSNQLTSLDVSGCPRLNNLSCQGNQLTSLNVSGCSNLSLLFCSSNRLTSLDLSKNGRIVQLFVDRNQLTSLDVSNLRQLSVLNCMDNQLQSLDVRYCTVLGTLYSSRNPLGKLDVSRNLNLRTLCCADNGLTELDVTNHPELMMLMCDGNQLTELDLTRNTKLSTLDCSRNPLGKIDVTHLENLQNFFCNKAELTELDISNNSYLKYLDCEGNQFTSLDLSNNTILLRLYCGNNQLTSLDLSNNTGLNRLRCNENPLHEIDVTPILTLWELDVRDTYITSLDLSTNLALFGVSIDPVLKELDLTATEDIPVNLLAAVGNGFVGITSTEDSESGWSHVLTAAAGEGAKFTGWYSDKECTKLITTNETVTFKAGEELKAQDYYAKFEGETVHEHTPGAPVREKEVPATCTKDGSYDEVVYCTVCKAEISRVSKTIPALGHDFSVKGETVAPTQTEEGYTVYQCSRCDATEHRDIVPAIGHKCPSKDFSDLNPAQWYHPYTDYVLDNGLMIGVGGGKFAPNGKVTRAQLVTTLYRLAGEPKVTELSTFTDVRENQWYAKAVAWAQDEGIAKGITDTTFRPDAPLTREQAATFLYRYITGYLKQEPVKGADLAVYKDADKISDYAKDAIAWATAEGIFEGFEDSTMRPAGTLVRVQLAKVLTVLDQKF